MEQDKESSDKNSLWEFFLNHSILVITILGLLMSSIGYASQYSLLKQFDIQFVNYAELDDFLLAAWKVPSSSITLIVICAGSIFISKITMNFKNKYDHLLSSPIPNKDKFKIRTVQHITQIFSIIAILIILWAGYDSFVFTTEKQKNEIFNQTTLAKVNLRTKESLPKDTNSSLSLISVTSKFMFFYQINHTNTETMTIAVPISSISNVVYVKVPIAVINLEQLTDEAE